MLAAMAANVVLLRRVGPRPLLVLGMLLAAAAMAWLAQLMPGSGYTAHVLLALIVMGLGVGNVIAPGIASATYGVDPHDSGVASALVNTMQHVGASVGTAVLSSIAAGAITSYAQGKPSTPPLSAEAAVHGYTVAFSVHGYTVAFWVAAGVFAFGALLVGGTMRNMRVQPGAVPDVEPKAVAA